MSTYRVIRLVGSSPTSWEEAAKTAVEEAAQHLEIYGLPKLSCST